MEEKSVIVIMGMKHTGKSTVGSLLAQRLETPFHDTDEVVRELTGKAPRELYDEGGSALMIARETDAVRYLVNRYSGDKTGCVIATGGGLADNAEALELLKKAGTLVFLDTPFELLFRRVMVSAERDGRLPGFLQGGDPEALFREVFLRRIKTYATISDIRITTGTRVPAELVQEIMDRTAHEQRTNIHR